MSKFNWRRGLGAAIVFICAYGAGLQVASKLNLHWAVSPIMAVIVGWVVTSLLMPDEKKATPNPPRS